MICDIPNDNEIEFTSAIFANGYLVWCIILPRQLADYFLDFVACKMNMVDER